MVTAAALHTQPPTGTAAVAGSTSAATAGPTLSPAILTSRKYVLLNRRVHRNQATAVGEHGLYLHHRNQVGDTVHDVSLSQHTTRIFGHLFECAPGACTIQGNC